MRLRLERVPDKRRTQAFRSPEFKRTAADRAILGAVRLRHARIPSVPPFGRRFEIGLAAQQITRRRRMHPCG